MKFDFNYSIPDEKNRNDLINKICEGYSFLTHGILSKSLCSRNIDYIQIGNPNKMVLYAGAFHGMEWLTSLLILHFCRNFCDSIKNNIPISDINISRFLKETGLILVPCVNPDGVEISLHGAKSAHAYEELVKKSSNGNTNDWQANARGVDINHNFNADWDKLHIIEQKAGIIGPAKTRYGGINPESEPETKALVDLCTNHNIVSAFAFHSQGEEIYWNYGPNTPPKSKLMAKILSVSSGYTVSQPEGLAIGGGFKDWFIQKLKRPGFTIEIGYGKNPLPLSNLEKIYNQLEESMVLGIVM